MSEEKKRLDILLLEREIFPSRSRARAEIMAGKVFVNGKKSDKPGLMISTYSQIEIKGRDNPYVSRGGLKLKKALEEFDIDLKGKVVLDIGASTGGFTDCMLEHGANQVYALDVGYGQLAWKLRNHQRVVNMERFNVRNLKREDLPGVPHMATIDVSFISLKKVLPVVASLNVQEVICLIKPQFEASPAQVGKKGVVRDVAVHEDVIKGIMELALKLLYRIVGLTFSPLKGPKGNLEYLLYLVGGTKNGPELEKVNSLHDLIKTVVSQAHYLL
jgi:23S rRNA (cytidine1920-2'-O)/16S rRNA (cytidine1409-2'-O)-methyltransferase